MDQKSREALIIDPVLETAERDLKLIEELGAQLKYIFDTHVHADHVTAAGELRKHTGAKSCVAEVSDVDCADVKLKDGDQIKLGEITLSVLETPGHTNGCLSLYSSALGVVFTGDSLMIRGNGRTDFQQGSSKKLFESIQQKLFTLPDATILFPGHDYRGYTSSTIGEEKKYNPRIAASTTFESFSRTMDELKLAPPRHIHSAVPANLACGKPVNSLVFGPQIVDGIPEITPQILKEEISKSFYIDIRNPDEWIGEYGYIPGAKRVTMGPELDNYMKTLDKNKEIVLVCRSGGRSGRMTSIFQQLGFKHVINLQGGMISWCRLGYETTKKI